MQRSRASAAAIALAVLCAQLLAVGAQQQAAAVPNLGAGANATGTLFQVPGVRSAWRFTANASDAAAAAGGRSGGHLQPTSWEPAGGVAFDFSEYGSKPMIVVIGDSISAFGFDPSGWAARLGTHYEGRVNMVNAAVGGAGTRTYLMGVWPYLLRPLEPIASNVALVTLCFGTNDAVLPAPTAMGWHVPLANYTSNLHLMISELQRIGINNIVVMTPPPVGQRTDRNNGVTGTYADAAIRTALDMRVPVVDVYSRMMELPDWQQVAFLGDHMHLSPLGHQVVYNSLLDVLYTQTPGVSDLGAINNWARFDTSFLSPHEAFWLRGGKQPRG